MMNDEKGGWEDNETYICESSGGDHAVHIAVQILESILFVGLYIENKNEMRCER